MQRYQKNKNFDNLNRQLKTRPHKKDLSKTGIIPDENKIQRKKSAEIAIEETLQKQIFQTKVKNFCK